MLMDEARKACGNFHASMLIPNHFFSRHSPSVSPRLVCRVSVFPDILQVSPCLCRLPLRIDLQQRPSTRSLGVAPKIVCSMLVVPHSSTAECAMDRRESHEIPASRTPDSATQMSRTSALSLVCFSTVIPISSGIQAHAFKVWRYATLA